MCEGSCRAVVRAREDEEPDLCGKLARRRFTKELGQIVTEDPQDVDVTGESDVDEGLRIRHRDLQLGCAGG